MFLLTESKYSLLIEDEERTSRCVLFFVSYRKI